MPNGNGTKNGNKRGRDADGLTAKQRASLAIIGVTVTPHAGVMECVKLGIVTRAHFYREWNHEPKYVKALNEARDEFQGEAKDRVKQIAIGALEGTTENVIKTAQGAGTNNMRAADIHFTLAGIDSGRGNRLNISTKVVTDGSSEGDLKRLSSEELSRRMDDTITRLRKAQIRAGSKNGKSKVASRN